MKKNNSNKPRSKTINLKKKKILYKKNSFENNLNLKIRKNSKKNSHEKHTQKKLQKKKSYSFEKNMKLENSEIKTKKFLDLFIGDKDNGILNKVGKINNEISFLDYANSHH